MARASLTAPASSMARPLRSRTTTGLPVAATASASASCGSGRPMSTRDWASADMFWLSPTASSTTSAWDAAITAASIPPSSGASTFEPLTTVRLEPSPSAARTPCSSDTARSGSLKIDQGPNRSTRSSPKGPIRA